MLGSLSALFRVPDIRKRLFITFGFLLLYRVGWNIPIPGIDLHALGMESNYDPGIQRRSDRPDFLKRRIMGGLGLHQYI